MNVRVLGSLEASINGHSLQVGAGKPRALFAILALHAGEPVSTDRLIGGVGGDGRAFATGGHGYGLQVAPGAVDAGHFEQLLADGEPREALALWRGPAL